MIRNVSRRTIKRSIRKFSKKTLSRGANRDGIKLEIGEINHEFQLEEKNYFKEYDVTLYKFKHTRLGTRHYHVDTPDTNNAFAWNFKTLPNDDTGKPHILEHISLCGSEKYPVRDPFFNMLKRSLSTFMNAWTGPDFTSYPYSTTNEKDYYNLMSVYTESTFKPKLDKNDFLQEGWRLDFEEEGNSESDLIFKGVVYNEMKGVYENPKNIFMEKLQHNLLKGTIYGVDSGGDPEAIPDLSHEDLVKFHEENYHPSNGSLFTYGDLNPLKHQKFLQDQYLKDFEASEPLNDDGHPTITEPTRIIGTKPKAAQIIEEGKETTFGISFLCQAIGENDFDSLGLSILSYLLFHTPKSPFYVEFLEQGLATGYCAGAGYESMLRNTSFTIGFENIKEGTSQAIEDRIFETLKYAAASGFDQNMIEGVLHNMEVSSKIAQDNFGLMIFRGLLAGINHDQDDLIKNQLKVTENINKIREKSQEGYFQELIHKYLLNNEKRVHLELNPDPEYMEKSIEKETEKLKEIRESLTEKNIEDIILQAQELKAAQESIQDTSVLPTLKVTDIPLQEEPVIFSKEEVDGKEIFFYEKPTNGVTHLRIKIDLLDLDSSIMNFLSLLSRFFTELGTTKHRYDEFAELIKLNLASINFSVNYQTSPLDQTEMTGYAVLKIACLDSKLEPAMKLVTQLLTQPNFEDRDHLLNLIRINSASAANALVENALGFAVSYGVASRSKPDQYYNSVLNNRFMCNLGKNIQKGLPAHYLEDIEQNFSYIMNKVMRKANISYSVHTGKDMKQKVLNQLDTLNTAMTYGYSGFEYEMDRFEMFDFNQQYLKSFFAIPSHVNYVTDTFSVPGYLHQDSVKLKILCEMLGLGQLHKLIREKGGAYGSGARLNAYSGALSFTTYRDPNTLQSLDNFRKAVEWVTEGHLTQKDVDEAKLSHFSKYDSPILPHNSGLSHFYSGITDEILQQKRGQYFDVTLEDLVDVADRYILQKMDSGESSKVIFGAENSELMSELESKGWFIENKGDISLQRGKYTEGSEVETW